MARPRKKKPVKNEEQTLQTSSINNNPVEAAEVNPIEVIKADADEPKLFEGKKMYWGKTMHFSKIGIVEGVILNRHWEIFLSTAPDDIDIYKWISSKDLKAEREERVRKKMKERIGLSE